MISIFFDVYGYKLVSEDNNIYINVEKKKLKNSSFMKAYKARFLFSRGLMLSHAKPFLLENVSFCQYFKHRHYAKSQIFGPEFGSVNAAYAVMF